jgi:hypothetical protein
MRVGTHAPSMQIPSGQRTIAPHALRHSPSTHAKPSAQPCAVQSSVLASEQTCVPVAGSTRQRASVGQSRLSAQAARQRPIAHTSGLVQSLARVHWPPGAGVA